MRLVLLFPHPLLRCKRRNIVTGKVCGVSRDDAVAFGGTGADGEETVFKVAGAFFESEKNVGVSNVADGRDVKYFADGKICGIRAVQMFAYNVEDVCNARSGYEAGNQAVLAKLKKRSGTVTEAFPFEHDIEKDIGINHDS